MYFRPAISACLIALLIVSGIGCQKISSPPTTAVPTILASNTVASVHWLGKKRLGITFGAYYLARIWQQPQSAQLERQTLVKLASNAGLWLPGGTNLSVDARSRLWWQLNDIVQEESYLEIRQPANGIAETVFAIQLNQAQSDQWLTNLPVVLEPLTGGHAVFNTEHQGWTIKTTNDLNLIQLARVGDWTLVGFAQNSNPLLAEISARIRHDGVPFVSAGTDLWIEASLDLPRLSKIFPLSAGGEGWGELEIGSVFNSQLSTLNRLYLSLSGDGANVITRAKFTFSKPLPPTLDPWRLPVDLMHEPLTSLTAVRGVQSWLASLPLWRDLQMGTPPDQFFIWSLSGNPYETYFAAPMTRSGASTLTDHLLQKANPWLAAHGYVSFDRAPDGNGVTWGNQPDIRPFLKSAGRPDDGWLYAGLFPDTNAAAALPPPAGLIQDILRRTNAVYYDWEVTGPRLQPTLEIAQTARLLTHQPQLSLSSASLTWLGAIIPRLGTSATVVNRTGPDELTLYRRSTLGLTAAELHVLTGWLESPQFPR